MLAAVSVVAASAGWLSGCAPSTSEPPSDVREVRDELGRTLKVKPRPSRIVSLAPSVTETLFALGLGDQIVGVTTFCDYPAEAQTKEKVGDTLRPNIERIVALKPDLAIASTSSQLEQFVKKLDDLGIPVFVSNPSDLAGVVASIEKIGNVAGASERAAVLSAELRARVREVETRVSGAERPNVLVMLGSEPLIAPGRPSFITDMINRAGGHSISGDESAEYPQYSLETAIAKRPDVIFLQSGEDQVPARLRETPASRSGRVFHLPDELLLRPGPRLIDGFEELARRIHPEVFEGGRPDP